MRQKKVAVVLLIYGALVSSPLVHTDAFAQSLSIIPKPQKVVWGKGFFTLNLKTKIVADSRSKQVEAIASQLRTKLRRSSGYPLPLVPVRSLTNVNNTIFLTDRVVNKSLGSQGYQLNVRKSAITIAARTPAGLFYAIQTLSQLMPPQFQQDTLLSGFDWKIACVDIQDSPRFPWRGMHLDVCRHFFPKQFIKKYLDLMSFYKLNTFHWHLTEDQGWRIEIKKYPKLTQIGSQRSETMGDSIPHGGYYTQEDIREIVQYAKERFITIVPEIEMPGHSTAALAAYPELSCTGAPLKVGTIWGVYEDVYCAGNETTFEFLQNVLGEVMDLFPGNVIHIGGDECPKTRWKQCPKCQERIRAEGLKDEHELQSYFMKRIEKYLNSKGRKVMGWDEILEGGLPPNASVMSWRGIQGGIEAAKSGHDVVMTPTDYCYFDYYQGTSGEPKAIGGYLPIDTVYSYEPVPSDLTPQEAKHIIGAQGNVWTEYVPDERHVEYMVLPRMLALSEVVWSQQAQRDVSDFHRRLEQHYDRLAALGLNFRVPPPAGAGGREIIFGDTIITLTGSVSNSEIRYTLDGSEPKFNSEPYTAPIKIKGTEVLTARTVLKNKRMSNPVVTTFTVVDPRVNGLSYRYYEGAWDSLPGFDQQVVSKSGWAYDIALDAVPHRPWDYALQFEGLMRTDSGDYTFYLTSDDGSRLFIDDKELINNDGLHGTREISGKINLSSGKHKLAVSYFNRGGDQFLELAYEGPRMKRQVLPPQILIR